MKKQPNIAVLGGGYSSERQISLNSAKQVFLNLPDEKFNKFLIDVSKDALFCIYENEKIKVDFNDFSINIKGEHIKFDFAFIVLHGSPGEDGKIQGYLDLLNIPYSACGLLASAITFDKIFCKNILQKNPNINLAKSLSINDNKIFTVEEFTDFVGLPCFVKPNTSGSSFGVSKVYIKEKFIDAVNYARKEDDIVLIEEYIKGTEVSCGVLKMETKEYIFPVTEISTNNDFFDTQAKYEDGFTDEITPARISAKATKAVQDTASLIYDELRCKGIVRIDFIVRDDIPYFLEVNSIPGMSEASIIPKQIAAAELNISTILTEIIENELKKSCS